MATGAGDVGVVPGVHTRPRARHWLRVRLAVSAAGGLLALLLLVLGTHPAPYEDLRAAVTSGGLASVEVVGTPVDGAGVDGTSVQEVRWRSGLLLRSTEVVALSPGSPRSVPEETLLPDDTPVVVADAGTALRELAPDLGIRRAEQPTTTWTVLGTDVPSWLGFTSAALWLAALTVLISGPEPWRLTRWGWFWSVLLVPPVGVALFLVLSGPTPPLPRPRRARRLGGGWGLLVALVLGAVLPVWAGG